MTRVARDTHDCGVCLQISKMSANVFAGGVQAQGNTLHKQTRIVEQFEEIK